MKESNVQVVEIEVAQRSYLVVPHQNLGVAIDFKKALLHVTEKAPALE